MGDATVGNDMVESTMFHFYCRRRGGEEQDTTGFVTLEALMLSRQEEERRTQTHFHAPEVPQSRAPPPPVSQRNIQGMCTAK